MQQSLGVTIVTFLYLGFQLYLSCFLPAATAMRHRMLFKASKVGQVPLVQGSEEKDCSSRGTLVACHITVLTAV